MPKPTIFISHSHQDNDWCRQFVAALQKLGYDVWYDEKGLAGGAQWVNTIARELEGRDVFAIILTPDSWSSDWVQKELQLALTTRRRIVPILIKQIAITGFLRTYQVMNALATQVDSAAQQFDTAVSGTTWPTTAGAAQGGGQALPAGTVPNQPQKIPHLVVLSGNSTARRFMLQRYNVLYSDSSGALAVDSMDSPSQDDRPGIWATVRWDPPLLTLHTWLGPATFFAAISVNGNSVPAGQDRELSSGDKILLPIRFLTTSIAVQVDFA